MIKLTFIMALVALLTACSSSRYQHAHDSIPTRLPNPNELKDAIPRAEIYSRGGNKKYQVRGINYQVLNSAEGFEQIGTASWYGNKFHGHLTSNGEIYDMYAMTAAHKNLPLPSYVKVTNITNNKSVIVRVNDRGPFHKKRIIDLSYSAAYKIGMLKAGTAKVKITAITEFDTVDNKDNLQLAQHKPDTPIIEETVTQENNYIQVFATSKLEYAQKTAKNISKRYAQTVNYPSKSGIYRIQVGPISNNAILQELLIKLKASGYPSAYLIRL